MMLVLLTVHHWGQTNPQSKYKDRIRLTSATSRQVLYDAGYSVPFSIFQAMVCDHSVSNMIINRTVDITSVNKVIDDGTISYVDIIEQKK